MRLYGTCPECDNLSFAYAYEKGEVEFECLTCGNVTLPEDLEFISEDELIERELA